MLTHTKESRIDDDVRSIPARIVSLDHGLPCRQLLAFDVGRSGFDAAAVLRRIGADHFDLDRPCAGALRDIQPRIALDPYRIDRIGDDGPADAQIVLRHAAGDGIAGQVSSRQSI